MDLDYAKNINNSIKRALTNKGFSARDGEEADKWENNGINLISFGIRTYELEEAIEHYYELVDIVKQHFENNYSDVEPCYFDCYEKGHWTYSVRMKISDKTKIEKLSKSKLKDEKIQKVQDELKAFNTKVLAKIQTQSAPLKTCTHCKSKIAIGFIKKIECNICKKPFYSNTELKRFENINIKLKKAKAA